MSELDVSKIFPGWSAEGILGSGEFGTVYLIRNEENGAFSSMKVLRVPPAPEAIDNAVKMGVSRDLLTTYFTKFKNDLSWEIAMYGNVKDAALAPVEELKTASLNGPGWLGFLRSGLYTPISTYFEKAAPTQEDAVRMGLELSGALESLAQYSMVHGDIRPSNVMVTDAGSYVLTDYAVRRCLERAGSGIFDPGDRSFDAPETEGETRTYTALSDIYSLGALLCWTANGGSMPEHGDPNHIRNIDPALAAVIKKAMAADPAERYQTAAQLKAELSKLTPPSRTRRRAMAAAAAFEAVKRNGGAVMTGARAAGSGDKPQEKGTTAYDFTETKPPRKEDGVKKSKAGWIVGLAAMLACLAVILVIWTPWKRPDVAGQTGTGGQSGSLSDETGGKGGQSGILGGETEGNGGETEGNGGQSETVGGQTTDIGSQTTDNGNQTEGNGGQTAGNGGQTAGNGGQTTGNGGQTRPQPTNNDILYPSDTQRITREELEGKTRAESYMLLNEIYARHGYIFKSGGDAEKYFMSQKWYKPVTSNAARVEAQFNDVEKDNMRTLMDYQREMGWRSGTPSTATPGGETEPGGETTPGGETEPGGETNPGGETEPAGPTENVVLFPSDTRLVTAEDLAGRSREEVTLMINEIYARHGYIFTNASIKAHFEAQSWYTPVTGNISLVVSMLNETEKANADFINAYMKEQGWR